MLFSFEFLMTILVSALCGTDFRSLFVYSLTGTTTLHVYVLHNIPVTIFY